MMEKITTVPTFPDPCSLAQSRWRFIRQHWREQMS